MEQFVDRELEIRTLEKEYVKKESSLVVVYGRRRVGKTTLLSEFMKGKKALYFLATQESEALNRSAFQEKAAAFIESSLLAETSADKWDTIFKAIVSCEWSEKPILIIDEFQYLGKANPAFPSVFQRIWDEILLKNSVMVILCGSLISMMVSQTLSYNSPLYGRRTAQIRLKQIPFRYYRKFCPGLSRKELIERYAVTGGVPKYIESFADCTDIFAGIEENILNRTGYLYEEPHFLLQQEVAEVGGYFSVLRAIAFGKTKLSEIASFMEVKATDLTRTLKTLMELDLVQREVPVTEENPEKSKKGLYRITDYYIRFWFTMIYPYQGDIEQGNIAYVMGKTKKSFVRSHAAFVYEDVCREELAAREDLPCHFPRIGRYWDKNTEIDIVAVNEEENRILFGECKYWSGCVDVDVFYQLQEKAKRVPWHKDNRKEQYCIFSMGGFSPRLQELAENRNDLILSE